MTTTTANAVPVFRHLEYCRQVLWPDMDVQLISTTEAWAQYSVAGPNARKLLEKLVDQDISDAAFPYMACGAITVCAACARGCSASRSRASWPMKSPCPPAMAMR